MTRRIACLVAFSAFALALTGTANVRAAEPGDDPKDIHGTWVGYWNVAGTKVKFTSTMKADGKYKTVMENGDYVTVERGSYKYADGVLETEPEGGTAGTYTVKFEDKKTMTAKGGGLTITFKKQ